MSISNSKQLSDEFTTEILTLSHEGRGISKHQQKKIFIDGVLPQEVVKYKVKKKHRHYLEGDVAAIVTPSPDRVSPPCQHFDICGGCSLQHLNMEAQLKHKQTVFLEQLHHFGSVKPLNLLPPLTAETIGYRRKARLSVRFVIKKNKLMVGFREKQSRYLADLDECVVLHPHIGMRLQELKQLISSLTQYQHIAQVEVAVGDHEAALIFRHLQPLSENDEIKLIKFGETYQFDIYAQPNPPEPLRKLYPNNDCYRLHYSLPEENLKFAFHPLDFTQVHLSINRMMVELALKHLNLSDDDIVLDLFSGIGNFTLPIAKRVKTVVGVEGSNEMVNRAYENARLNQIDNAEFHADNLQSPHQNAPWLKHDFTKILLDPPRAGAKEVLPLLQSFMAKTIVYISCNPATLARDAGDLVHQYSYVLTHAGIINMFAHTAHTESIAVFEKK